MPGLAGQQHNCKECALHAIVQYTAVHMWKLGHCADKNQEAMYYLTPVMIKSSCVVGALAECIHSLF